MKDDRTAEEMEWRRDGIMTVFLLLVIPICALATMWFDALFSMGYIGLAIALLLLGGPGYTLYKVMQKDIEKRKINQHK